MNTGSPFKTMPRAMVLGVLVGVIAAGGVHMSRAGAADAGPTTFMGQKVKPLNGVYLVLKDANVRAKPETKSKKLGAVKAGRRITVVGAAAGAWVAAVGDDGKPLGFIYDRILMPLIDGRLVRPITGRVEPKGAPACDFRIRFEGKSAVEGEDFEIADYDVAWTCKSDTGNKAATKFRTPMFITEAPFQLGPDPVYQISLDVIELFGGIDEVFSSIVLYDRDKGQVRFDSVSAKKYGRTPDPKSAPARDIAEALEGAAKIAISAWNKDAWADLIKNKAGG